MLEVSNINPINKGTLLASCSVRIIPWKITIHEINIFQKGANRWISLPSKQSQKDDGQKVYNEFITFDAEAVKNRFRDQIMVAIDAFLEKNPDMTPEDVIKSSDDGLPF